MLLGSVALIALVLAVVTRRPVRFLLQRRFKRLALLALAVALQLLFGIPFLHDALSARLLPGVPQAGGLLYGASLLLLLAFVWENRRILGVAVVGLGLAMNAAVILANGGQMPVDPAQLAAKEELTEARRVEASGRWTMYSVAGADTRLVQLGDWLMVPRPLIGPVILSPGDVVIAAGLVMFFLVIPEAGSGREPGLGSPSTPRSIPG